MLAGGVGLTAQETIILCLSREKVKRKAMRLLASLTTRVASVLLLSPQLTGRSFTGPSVVLPQGTGDLWGKAQ